MDRCSGWRDVAAALAARGLRVVATGGPAEAERRYLDEVWDGAPVTRRDGQLDWPQLAGLLAKARVYVGPDTSVTHLAAAAGCPTVALYGPTDPRLWGPWPVGGLEQIWAASGTIQHRGNVWLVQNPLPCMPCQLEGCERRLDSYSQCLIELPAEQVIAAVDQALAAKAVKQQCDQRASRPAQRRRGRDMSGVSKVTAASATKRDVQEEHAADDLHDAEAVVGRALIEMACGAPAMIGSPLASRRSSVMVASAR